MLFPFKKRREKENLIKTPVLITDTSLDSPNYFVINNYPNEFTSGKNAIRLYGSRNLVPGSEILVEVLDGAGNPVYSEINDYRDQHNNFIISVSVYDDTVAGIGTITLLGVASRGPNGELIPTDWQNKYNVKWTRQITLSPTKRNDSEIIIDKPPLVTLNLVTLPYYETLPVSDSFAMVQTQEHTEYVFQGMSFIGGDSSEYTYDIATQKSIFNPREAISRVDLTSFLGPISKTTNTVDGTISKKLKDVYNGVQIQDLAAYNNIIYLPTTQSVVLTDITGVTASYTGGFTDLMIGGKFNGLQFGSRTPLTASGLSIDSQVTDETYTSTIIDVLDNTRAVLETPYNVTYRTTTKDGSSALTKHRYKGFADATASITYKTKPEFIASDLISQSLVLFTINDLTPLSGDIYRIKTYQKESGRIGEYQIISDDKVSSPEILIDSTLFNDLPYIDTQFKWYGSLTPSNLANYWKLYRDSGTNFYADSNFTNTTYLETFFISNKPQLNSFILDKEQFEQIYPSLSVNSLVFTGQQLEFFKVDQTYRLTFKLTADFETTATPVDLCELEVYASSENLNFTTNPSLVKAFEPTFNLDKSTQTGVLSRYGKLIGSVKSRKGKDRYKTYNRLSFEFNADNNGVGKLLFRVKNGAFHISEVHITPAIYNGFTPNYISYTVPLFVGDETSWGITSVSQSVDFKFEYFDYLGRQSDYITYINNVRINELSSPPSLGCNNLIISPSGTLPGFSPTYTPLSAFSNFARQQVGAFGYVYPGGNPDAAWNGVVSLLNAGGFGTADYPNAFGWNHNRKRAAYYSGSFGKVQVTEDFGGNAILNSNPLLEPFGSTWAHSSSWVEGYGPALDKANLTECSCIAKAWASESWRRFDALSSSGYNKATANTYLKQTRLYWPATTGSSINDRYQYTPFEQGGVYKLKFTLKSIVTGSMGLISPGDGAMANQYALSGSGIEQFESDPNGVLNIYIYDVGSGILGTNVKANLAPGISSWYPPTSNIVQITYNDIVSALPYPFGTDSIIFEDIMLTQWGHRGRLVFEASGSNNGFFGGCIDDVEICKVGQTTDTAAAGPPSYVYNENIISIPTPISQLPNVKKSAFVG